MKIIGCLTRRKCIGRFLEENDGEFLTFGPKNCDRTSRNLNGGKVGLQIVLNNFLYNLKEPLRCTPVLKKI